MPFDFAANKVVDNLDSVPEKYRGLYGEVTDGENAGKFTVTEAARGIIDDYTGTTKSLEDLRGKTKSANDEAAQRRVALKGYEQIMADLDIPEDSRTADGLKAKIEDLLKSSKSAAEVQSRIETIKREMAAEHSKQLEAKDGEISEMRTSLNKYLIDGEASRALAAAKGSPDLLLPHIKERCKVVKGDNGDYMVHVMDGDSVRYNGAGDAMTVTDLVTEMKSNPTFARAFDSETAKGSGTHGNNQNQRPAQQRRVGEEKPPNTKISDGLTKRMQGRP